MINIFTNWIFNTGRRLLRLQHQTIFRRRQVFLKPGYYLVWFLPPHAQIFGLVYATRLIPSHVTRYLVCLSNTFNFKPRDQIFCDIWLKFGRVSGIRLKLCQTGKPSPRRDSDGIPITHHRLRSFWTPPWFLDII